MRIFLKAVMLLLLLPASFVLDAQDTSLQHRETPLRFQSVVFPAGLIVYGFIGLESHTVQNIDLSTQFEFREHIDKRFSIDDISQYSPFMAVYALNLFGVKGRNNLKNETIVLGTAYLIMGSSVNLLKATQKVRRPDGTSYHSFPSGHTATAFMGAEFLHQEFKHRSAWYGVAGYVVAAGTGFFRMYNNRHWISDVLTGAGIGILSTKIAYYFFPILERKIFSRPHPINKLML